MKYHLELTRLFAAHLHDNKVTLSGVNFTISSSIISDATKIPNVREKWFKHQDLDEYYYEPYIKPQHRNQVKLLFPFKFLENKYFPMTKIIMKYFTCEGWFSRLYTYHIRLLMHFTRVRMLKIPYYLSGVLRRWILLSKGSLTSADDQPLSLLPIQGHCASSSQSP